MFRKTTDGGVGRVPLGRQKPDPERGPPRRPPHPTSPNRRGPTPDSQGRARRVPRRGELPYASSASTSASTTSTFTSAPPAKRSASTATSRASPTSSPALVAVEARPRSSWRPPAATRPRSSPPWPPPGCRWWWSTPARSGSSLEAAGQRAKTDRLDAAVIGPLRRGRPAGGPTSARRRHAGPGRLGRPPPATHRDAYRRTEPSGHRPPRPWPVASANTSPGSTTRLDRAEPRVGRRRRSQPGLAGQGRPAPVGPGGRRRSSAGPC